MDGQSPTQRALPPDAPYPAARVSAFHTGQRVRRPSPNMKMPRKPQIGLTKPSGLRSPETKPQNAQRNYERYLALARAEALGGDRIAAENYFQHAEHYLRSMQVDGAQQNISRK